MILEAVCVGPMQTNCYILALEDNSPGMIIDPGDQAQKIKKVLAAHKIKPEFIINTHGHYDHIGGDNKFGIPVYIHRREAGFLENPELNLSGLFAWPYKVEGEIRLLEEGDIITLGGLELSVIHMPGHTPGGIALHMQKPDNKVLFSGDSLFRYSIGRTDLAGGDQGLLIKCIKEKLFKLADDTVIYPGHGAISTIGEEKRNNPFLTAGAF